ncbi:Detected protein of unknown function [Hibiscus syriacus]|uniref:Uncharacterized protein n=1 Tax=Hibiscus syriacus TaxID=106335 RepID=A0A6A2XZ12_HIBSY|nr:Detected protein of unknown function [Hibiscus syriacus]
MVRAPFYDKNGVKKGAWSPEEDDKLRSFIETFGHCKWRQLPKLAGLQRCGKSCRLRWVNYLRPEVKHGNFTEEENALILRLHEEYGNSLKCEAEIIHIDMPPNMILESSALSPTTKALSSTVELHAATSPVFDSGGGDTKDVDLPLCSSALYEDGSNGDFWSEPFVTEKDLPQHDEISGDDNVDLIVHQMMHECEYLDC